MVARDVPYRLHYKEPLYFFRFHGFRIILEYVFP